MVAAKGWGRSRNGNLAFNGYKVSIRDDEKVLWLDGRDSCTTI